MGSDGSPQVDEPLAMTSTALRALAIVVIVSMVIFWVWIFSGAPKKNNPDYLDDRAFVDSAIVRCDRLRVDLETLPNARDAADADERADTLVVANEMVSEMVDDLRGIAPATGEDGARLEGWFTDWDRYLDDRDRYVETLRTDPNAPFEVTPHPEFNDGVDETIRVFADVNKMRSCRIPGDVG